MTRTGLVSFRPRAGSAALGLGALLAATMTAPAAADPISLSYSIAVSGTRAMKMTFDGNVGKSAYKAHVRIKPAGFMGLFIKKSFDLSGSGRISAKGAIPARFSMTVKKKKKARTGTITWNGGKMHWRRTPAYDQQTVASVWRAMGKGAPDPLSLLIGMAGRAPAQSCKGTRRVFDGHYVYDLKLSLRGKTAVKSAFYRGPATICRMLYVPVAGMSEKKKRKILADPWIFNLVLIPLTSKEAGRLMAPVRAYGRVKGRNFTASLSAASIGGRPLRP